MDPVQVTSVLDDGVCVRWNEPRLRGRAVLPHHIWDPRCVLNVR